MARARNGQAIGEARRTPEALAELEAFTNAAELRGDLDEWRRGRAVQLYVTGERVAEIHTLLDVVPGTVNQWLRWYETMRVRGLETWKQPGAAPRLSEDQRAELVRLVRIIETGPVAAGFSSGLRNGPMIGRLIRERFDVTYHNHHIPRFLHQLGFSVQRPRKRLARTPPRRRPGRARRSRTLKKAADCRGIVAFEDEASFLLDGTLHQTWSKVGVQPRVDTYGMRKTAHVFGAIALDDADFVYQFAPVFNGHTFHEFLMLIRVGGFACPGCGGPLALRCVVVNPPATRRILDGLRRATGPPGLDAVGDDRTA